MLAEIYSWFTEGLETRDQQEAKALREEFPPERSSEGLGVLPSPTSRLSAPRIIRLLQFVGYRLIVDRAAISEARGNSPGDPRPLLKLI